MKRVIFAENGIAGLELETADHVLLARGDGNIRVAKTSTTDFDKVMSPDEAVRWLERLANKLAGLGVGDRKTVRVVYRWRELDEILVHKTLLCIRFADDAYWVIEDMHGIAGRLYPGRDIYTANEMLHILAEAANRLADAKAPVDLDESAPPAVAFRVHTVRCAGFPYGFTIREPVTLKEAVATVKKAGMRVDKDILDALQHAVDALKGKEDVVPCRKDKKEAQAGPEFAPVIAMRARMARDKEEAAKREADLQSRLVETFKPVNDVLQALYGCRIGNGRRFSSRVDATNTSVRVLPTSTGPAFCVEASRGVRDNSGNPLLVLTECGHVATVSAQTAIDRISRAAVELGIRLPGE